MKKPFNLLLLSLPLFTLWFCTMSSSGKESQQPKSLQKGSEKPGFKPVAVLELFTSQGCSSCPPADRLLGTYLSNKDIIALSFHVDYWNRLGWKDPYSSSLFTDRQHNYASALNSDVYTPQLIINGQKEMIGSDANKIAEAIKKVSESEPVAGVSIKKVQQENGRVIINFVASGSTANSVLNIALVEKKTTTEIKAGENGGATLTNYNVVRNFKTVSDVNNGDNTTDIDIPADLKTGVSVVIYLQEKKTNKISGGDQAAL